MLARISTRALGQELASRLANSLGVEVPSTRLVLPLLTGWRFLYESIDGPVEPTGEWMEVRLPHDYSIEDLPGRDSPFERSAPGSTSTGYTLGGIGVYRRVLLADRAWKGRTVRLLFDGVYQDARVSLNGNELCHHPYGYSPFFVDLTDHLDYGGENELVVRTDTSGKHTRWYSGSGIYRPVSLLVTGPTAFAPWGALADTPSLRTLRFRWNVEGPLEGVTLRLRLLGPDGSTELSSVSTSVQEARGEVALQAPDALAWSHDRPILYLLAATLERGGAEIDSLCFPVGFRTVEVHPDFGLLLNGSPVKVRGACVHHDNGCLGAKAYPAAEERRVRQLKALGFNAVRTAHNPPSAAFLDACDRLGLLVLDEAFDQWSKPKNPQDYHRFFPQHGKADLLAMVLRDYNHPSVIAWSIGNEIPERADPEGVAIAESLVAAIRSIDNLRPISAGVHSFWDQPNRPWREIDPAFQHLDIAGYNYQWREYEPDRQRVPRRVIWGTESFPKEAHDSWVPALRHAWVVGDFVWTGMDYVGEAGIGHFRYPGEPDDWADPSVAYTAAGCGDIDLAGDIRPQGLFRQVLWGTGRGLKLCVDAVPEGGESST
ncbi:MAG: hypothetical protein N2109_12935, partial [Fimbriimonadales bacterium]|nr:hypothetical protein [Fimbriimonadales bacterium]